MEGLSLIDEFDNANNCQFAIIGGWDKWVQFQNNYTEETGGYIKPEDRVYVYPLMNFTGALAGDMSDIPLYCYSVFGIEVLAWWETLYNSMSYDFNTLLISFLFT
jgi:hypothetical protein